MYSVGKLVGGVLVFPDNKHPTIVDGEKIWSSNTEFLLANGWKSLILSEPETRTGYRPVGYHWQESDSAITKVWDYEAIEPTIAERMATAETAISDINLTLDGAQDLSSHEERISAVEGAIIELADLISSSGE